MTPNRRGRHRSAQAPVASESRHSASEGRSRTAVAGIAVVAVLAIGGAAVAIDRPWQHGPATRASHTTPTTNALPAPAAREVRVWAGDKDDPLVGKLAPALGPTYRVVSANSPAASDVQLLPADATDDPAVVATSSVVLAMPAPMATAFGPPTPQNLQQWFIGKTTWKAKGHADLGSFTVALPDPATTPTGVIGYAALLAAVNGGPVKGTPDYTHLTPATLAMVHVEQVAIVTPSAAASNALLDATDPTSFAKAASAVLTTEHAVAAHNAQPGAQQLVGIPLLGGAAAVPVSAVASSTSSETVAAQVIRALRSSSGQQALRTAGFRGTGGGQSAMTGAAAVSQPQPVTAAAVNSTRAAWKSAHQLVSTVALLDMSGSMANTFPGTKAPKIAMLQQMIHTAYSIAPPKSRSTVWFFANRAGGPIMDGIPLAANSAGHVKQIEDATKKARPGGGSPVYLAIEHAYDYAVKHYTPGMTNRVLVLSDGVNEDAGSTITLSQVKEYVAQRFDPKRPVTLNLLLIDPGSNHTALEQIAKVTKGSAVPINSMADVPKVFASSVFG